MLVSLFLHKADIFSALAHPVLLHVFVPSTHLLPVITGNYDTCGNTGLAYVERENAQVIFNDNDALSLGLVMEPQWSPLHRNSLFPCVLRKPSNRTYHCSSEQVLHAATIVISSIAVKHITCGKNSYPCEK